VKGDCGQQDYGMRIYDNRLGRFLSVDPLVKDYPWNSTYSFAENNPIEFVDLDGAERAYRRPDGIYISPGDQFSRAIPPEFLKQFHQEGHIDMTADALIVGFIFTAPIATAITADQVFALTLNCYSKIGPLTTGTALAAGKYGPEALGFAAALFGYDGEIPGTNGDDLARLLNKTGLKYLAKVKEIYKIGARQNVAVAKFANGLTNVVETFVANSGQTLPGTTGIPDAVNRLFMVAKGREYDTEVKLLETIAKKLGGESGKVIENAKGTVTIASDLSACPSCSGVIDQFKAMFPNVKVIMGSSGKSTYSN
jgi:RHS repeat-associated protein